MADFERATGITIREAFEKFDEANPKVYELIKREALRAIRLGRPRLSIKNIIGWIRWERFIETEDGSSGYKINDAYSAHYARKFIRDYPHHEDKVELRQLRAKEPTTSSAASTSPPPPPDGFLFDKRGAYE